MKPYSQLTTEEKLSLTDETFNTAVKLEAVERGIQLPITLEQALVRSEFRGFSRPADSVSFYELCGPGQYSGNVKGTGVCYRTREEASRALEGVIHVEEDGYGAARRNTIREGGWSIREVFVSISKASFSAPVLEQYRSDTTKYDALGKECSQDLWEIQQAKYDAEVMATKRKTYLDLAQGNEEIARAFWAKAEYTPWEAAAPDRDKEVNGAEKPVKPEPKEVPF